MPIKQNESPAIWQSYVNAIPSSIHERSRYLAIMDDLLLHSSKHAHLKYLKDLLKVLHMNSFENITQEFISFSEHYPTLGNTNLTKDNKSCM